MTLCPIALASSCKQCFMFKICPAKGIIGDYKKDEAPSESKPKSESGKH